MEAYKFRFQICIVMQIQTARAERGVLSHAERGCALGQVLCVAHAERGTKCHAEREPCTGQNLGFSRSR